MRNKLNTAVFLSVCTLLHIGITRVSLAAFVPGHAYAPVTDGYIIEYDENLNQVGMVQVPGVWNTSGATFGPDGNLVFVARRNNNLRYVVEVDSKGELIRQFEIGGGSFLAGSYIDYDPVTERYAVADDDQVIILDRDLNYLTSTISTFEFSRASGVAWGLDQTLFVNDQLEDDLFLFDQRLAVESLGFVGEGPTGMDYADGHLYLTLFGAGALLQYDPFTNTSETIVPGLGFGEMSDITVLPDGNLLTISKNHLLRLFSPDGTLLDASDPTIYSGDGFAYYIPAPGASLLLTSVCLFRTHRRRRAD